MFKPSDLDNAPWKARLSAGILFFFASCLVLTGFRLFFFLHFRSGGISFGDFWPALVMGARVDAKWLAILLLPAWVAAVVTMPWKKGRPAVRWLSGLALLLAVAAGLLNTGFYAFYGTPVSSIVFGLFQDDTTAILKTIAADWPVGTYLLTGLVCYAFPWGLLRLFGRWIPGAAAASRKTDFELARNSGTNAKARRLPTYLPTYLPACLSVILASAALGLTIRGSLSTFPLRLQDFAVSPKPFVNDGVTNGLAALYVASKEQRALDLSRGGANQGLTELGFASPEEALALLKEARAGHEAKSVASALEHAPHVVFALMESMGRDLFESHDPKTNDMLGALEEVLPQGFIFKKGIAVQGGTFPSLEGLLYDTPITPISQSRYGHQRFPFSNALPFKRAGYRTVFLTSGPEKWRSLDRSLPLQGFDEVIGAAKLEALFPQAQAGVWGLGDEWMFRYAEELLKEADARGEKLFLMMLSTTNHPPYRVPDGRPLVKVDPARLPDYVVRDLPPENQFMRMQTFHYSTNELGKFVKDLESGPLASKTLIAATGDHNSRYTYKPDGWWPHGNGVPVMFWAPASLVKTKVDTERFASSRDVFPTLRSLALGEAPLPHQGRNLLGPDDGDPADVFTGLGANGYALSAAGAAMPQKGGEIACFAWSGPQLVPAECTAELRRIGSIARAKRALSDYAVRSALLAGAKRE